MLIMLAWIFSNAAQAQAQAQAVPQRWATVISPDELTDEEIASLPGMDHPTSGSDLYYIRFSDVATLNNEELYTVKLTAESLEYAFDPSYVEIEDGGDFYLAGSIAGYDASFEFTPITGYNGRALIENQVVDFIGITESLSHVRYADVTDDDGSHDNDCLEYTYDGNEVESTTPNMCSAVVDVLFLRTSEVENSFPYTTAYHANDPTSWTRTVADFEELVTGEVRRTNKTLENSNIGSKRVNIIPNDIDPIDVVIEHPSNIFTTHARLRQSVIIQQLRQEYDADVVVMYFFDLPQYGGVANNGYRVPAIYDDSYVSNSFASSAHAGTFPKTAAHELGHVFGGHHPKAFELIDNVTGDPTGKPTMLQGGPGYGVPWGDTYKTVSHYSNENVNYILDSGNPAVTGSSDRNNAIEISNNFCDVAEFEQSGTFESFIVFDYGPSIPLCSSTIPLCADVVSGNTNGPNSGPYTYEWRYSLFPNASQTLFSTEECPVFSIPFPSHTFYYVTLDVIDVNSGQRTSASKVARFNLCTPDYARMSQGKPQTNKVSNALEDEEIINVGVGSNLRTISSSLDISNAELFRTDGVKLGYVNFVKGQTISFDVSTPSGLYYIVLRSKDGQTETHPVWYVH